MDLSTIQKALSEAGVDGWLFCDFHHRDQMAYKILGLDSDSLTSRRWFYFLPTEGQPVKLSHKVEPRKLDSLPGDQQLYLAYTELHEKLAAAVRGKKTIAMQYSPMNNIPYVSVVDAGTIELVRSFGVEIVSSADLVQQFDAVTGEDGYRSHCETGTKVHAIKDEAFKGMDDALRKGQQITEYDVREFILSRFEQEGLTADGSIPIVGFNDHPADPHFEPTKEIAHTLHHGDTILLDLWARRQDPPGVYYDITWCGFAGQEVPMMYGEIWGVVTKARDAGLDFVRRHFDDGRPCHGWEVDDAVRTVVKEAGFGEHFLHRTGHSIGVSDVHGNGANLDNLETKDERLLVPGTCFSIEPGIYLEGRMAVRTEIDVYITPQGQVEVFGPIQKDLLLIG
jgi:Xaa-Pro aminopeptidase